MRKGWIEPDPAKWVQGAATQPLRTHDRPILIALISVIRVGRSESAYPYIDIDIMLALISAATQSCHTLDRPILMHL
ncbi:unnamed protein product [Strongylus vulgaris]|uniref:Uncharacterized protein n=1 Tax=Strongylus vulgaris TaxID=40348 RepID=A0A3P7LN97_STRVU|nr:unnamed protein product [Strongylus vulgaris]